MWRRSANYIGAGVSRAREQSDMTKCNICLPVHLSISQNESNIYWKCWHCLKLVFEEVIYIPWNKEKGSRRLSWSYNIDCLDFLETKGHIGVSQLNLACLFWCPILIKSPLWLFLTSFWWPIQTWLTWKHIVALEILSRHVLVTVFLKELDIKPILFELAKLSLFHWHKIFCENL